jgi:hypothetical protein
MTYIELLQLSEWITKRNEIVERDRNKCQNCLNQKYLYKTVVPFNILPYLDKTKIIIDEEPFEILVDKNFTHFLNFKKIGKESVVILDVFGDKTQIIGFCVLDIFFTKKQIEEESEQLISQEVEELTSNESRKNAIKKYLTSYSIKHLEIKKELSIRYINENIKKEDSIKWFDIKNLHVHHKYYQKGRLPWEYPNDALITLCWDCHENLHKNESIPFIDENGKEIGKLKPCPKCFGAGYFPEYNHIQNGVCFECNGAKYKEFT